MGYPMVRQQVEAGKVALHGWHYVIEEGEVHVFDVKSGEFIPASTASHSGTGPYQEIEDSINTPVFNEIDESYANLSSLVKPDRP
jgi:carbonic anhydrase